MSMMYRSIVALALGLSILVAHNASAGNEWVVCDPVHTATFTNRIHVECSASVSGGVRYFARAVSDDADAGRFLSVIIAAQVAGRTLRILTDLSDTTGASFECAASDCRLLKAVEFGN